MKLVLQKRLQSTSGFNDLKKEETTLKTTLARGDQEPQKNGENIEAAQNLIEEDRRITVNQIATSLDISYGLTNSILHDNLGLSMLSARWVPKALRPDQQNLRSDLSLTLLNKIEADEEQFLAKIITGFTSTILSPKKQSKQWLPRVSFRTHQVQTSNVGSKSDGRGFLGFRGCDTDRLP